jgi:hypothetical protein
MYHQRTQVPTTYLLSGVIDAGCKRVLLMPRGVVRRGETKEKKKGTNFSRPTNGKMGKMAPREFRSHLSLSLLLKISSRDSNNEPMPHGVVWTEPRRPDPRPHTPHQSAVCQEPIPLP